MKKQLAWILGGGSVVAVGVIAGSLMGGCTNNDGNKDSGVDSATDTTQNDVANNDVANDQGAPDAGADCKTVPSGAPFETDSGPYCPFQATADGGLLFSSCGRGNHCCDWTSGSNPSTCQPLATPCGFDAGTNADFVCNESADCAQGQICCMPGATSGQDLGCSYYFAGKDHGTTCVTGTTCPSGLQICGQTADCPNGKTCQPLSTLAAWLGVCL
jgi:hypothetical protein